jgi:hypothetical protein
MEALLQILMGKRCCMKTKKATFAIYKDKSEIKTAIRALTRLGFKDKDLAVLQPVKHGAKDFPQVQRNQILNGAIYGAILGAFVAGCLYLFVGPGLDSHVANLGAEAVRGGLIASVWILLGALAGAACGALVGIGTPYPTGKRYGQYMHSGGILLSVESETPEEAARAESILLATGGQDVHMADEKHTWDSALMKNIEISHEKSASRNIIHSYT